MSKAESTASVLAPPGKTLIAFPTSTNIRAVPAA